MKVKSEDSYIETIIVNYYKRIRLYGNFIDHCKKRFKEKNILICDKILFQQN